MAKLCQEGDTKGPAINWANVKVGTEYFLVQQALETTQEQFRKDSSNQMVRQKNKATQRSFQHFKTFFRGLLLSFIEHIDD